MGHGSKTSFRGVSVLEESGNVLSLTWNFDGIPILPFVAYEHGKEKVRTT